MSKSSGQAVWLSSDTEDHTAPYAFYQYWINLPDADVVAWLRMFTLLPGDEIVDLARRHEAEPQRRVAQKALARHMTEMVHGAGELDRVEKATEALFGAGDVRELDAPTLAEVFADVPHTSHDKALLEGDGVSLVDVLSGTSLAGSKRAAREHLSLESTSPAVRCRSTASSAPRIGGWGRTTCSRAARSCCAAARSPGTPLAGPDRAAPPATAVNLIAR
ncbi:MAG: hypothetical protein ACYTAQ_10160 [Planctomycetota bacterium]|jgi:tyrosyl-tRNA synthetase